MKKAISRTLIISLALLGSSAWGLNHEQWKAYCDKSDFNKQRCETAMRLCEQNDKADCDKIRTAFMLEQPIPTSVIPTDSTD